MRIFLFLSFFLLTSCTNTNSADNEAESSTNTKIVFHSHFNELAKGDINAASLAKHYPSLKWAQPFDRVSNVLVDDKAALRVRYPKGGVGPHKNGAQFLVNLPQSERYTLEYSVYFEDGFDFRLGGKLPGLTSGGEKWSGGNRPLNGEGWSARLMWREHGLAELYLYYVDMEGKWGDSIEFDGYKFETGKWYDIKEQIEVNEPGQKNASIKIWINDKMMLDMQNFRLRVTETGRIDSLYFSTFHGGNQPNWGPLNDSSAYFGDFVVSR